MTVNVPNSNILHILLAVYDNLCSANITLRGHLHDQCCNMIGNHLYQVGGIASYIHDIQSIMICFFSVTVC